MDTLEMRVIKVTTKTEDDTFERVSDGNGMTSIPKQFVVNFECKTMPNRVSEDKPETVYFTHRFKFSETMSIVGGAYHPAKKESDFVIFFEGKREKHIGGLDGDQSYFTRYGTFTAKFAEGERMRVKATVEEKVSQKGNRYKQLKRVKLDRDYSYHSKL